MRTPAAESYVVVAGDFLSGIAAAANVSLDSLIATNGWPDGSVHVIYPGDVIALPAGATQPSPKTPTTVTPTSAGTPVASTTITSPTDAVVGGYREVTGDALLSLQADGATHTIDNPLQNGVYDAESYNVSSDGSSIEFHLARFFEDEACRATLPTDSAGTIDESDCYGGKSDLTKTAVVRLSIISDAPIILTTGDYRYVQVTAAEFARLLLGNPPAADAPEWFTYARYWGALVEIDNGTVLRANQRPTS
ncbi:MAG: hypothetical protein JWL72_2208 [Ilumatobacteraceae bacterium]|nr:hypothetical protein [Ilumatobacteraceae bacterium]